MVYHSEFRVVRTIFPFASACDFKVFNLSKINIEGCFKFFLIDIFIVYAKQAKKQMPVKKSNIDRIAVGNQMNLDEVSCDFIP